MYRQLVLMEQQFFFVKSILTLVHVQYVGLSNQAARVLQSSYQDITGSVFKVNYLAFYMLEYKIVNAFQALTTYSSPSSMNFTSSTKSIRLPRIFYFHPLQSTEAKLSASPTSQNQLYLHQSTYNCC
mgnify:FL=1